MNTADKLVIDKAVAAEWAFRELEEEDQHPFQDALRAAVRARAGEQWLFVGCQNPCSDESRPGDGGLWCKLRAGHGEPCVGVPAYDLPLSDSPPPFTVADAMAAEWNRRHHVGMPVRFWLGERTGTGQLGVTCTVAHGFSTTADVAMMFVADAPESATADQDPLYQPIERPVPLTHVEAYEPMYQPAPVQACGCLPNIINAHLSSCPRYVSVRLTGGKTGDQFAWMPHPEQEADEELDDNWLVWSNKGNGWWSPGNRGYRDSVLHAGRHTKAAALNACALRTPTGTMPPEVAVQIPNLSNVWTVQQLEELMRKRADDITLAQMRARQRA